MALNLRYINTPITKIVPKQLKICHIWLVEFNTFFFFFSEYLNIVLLLQGWGAGVRAGAGAGAGAGCLWLLGAGAA